MRRTGKSPEQLRRDEDEDTQDLEKRLQRNKDLVRKIFSRRKRLSRGTTDGTELPNARAAIDPSAKSSGKVGPSALLRGLGRHRGVARGTALLALALVITYLLHEPFTAATLTVVAMPHLISELVKEGYVAGWRSLNYNADSLTLVILSVMTLVGSMFSQKLSARLVPVMSVYGVLLPEIFPTVLVEYLRKLRDARSPAQQAKKAAAAAEALRRMADDVADLKLLPHYYKIVGECYIHGMMNGEAIEWQNKTADPSYDGQRIMAEVFEIR